jgi:hypothetical protein
LHAVNLSGFAILRRLALPDWPCCLLSLRREGLAKKLRGSGDGAA